MKRTEKWSKIDSWIELNQSILKSGKIEWFGKRGIVKIAPGFIGEITLDYTTIDSYTFYRVKIISVATGNCITENNFYFGDWCERNTMLRDEYTGPLYINVDNGKPKWYIHRPLDTERLEKEIFKFFEVIK